MYFLVAVVIFGGTVVLPQGGSRSIAYFTKEECETMKADMIRQGVVSKNAAGPHQHFVWCVKARD